MANLELLKNVMCQSGKTYEDGAKIIGTSITTFNDKMNGKRKFYVPEAEMLCNELGLSDIRRCEIFLPKNLHDIHKNDNRAG